jgi:hypothetical protein
MDMFGKRKRIADATYEALVSLGTPYDEIPLWKKETLRSDPEVILAETMAEMAAQLAAFKVEVEALKAKKGRSRAS